MSKCRGKVCNTYFQLPCSGLELTFSIELKPAVVTEAELIQVGGEVDKRLLYIRVFDDRTKRIVYNKQTAAAQKTGVSNCPLCAVGHDVNKAKIWKFSKMDADHVTA